MENTEKPEEKCAGAGASRPSRRRSLFTVLNNTNGSYYWNNDAYEKLMKAELSEWNKLIQKDFSATYLKSNPTPNLETSSIREKIASFSLDTEAFLAEQKEFKTIAEEFLRKHRDLVERNELLKEATDCILDDATIYAVEEEEFKKKTS